MFTSLLISFQFYIFPPTAERDLSPVHVMHKLHPSTRRLPWPRPAQQLSLPRQHKRLTQWDFLHSSFPHEKWECNLTSCTALHFCPVSWIQFFPLSACNSVTFMRVFGRKSLAMPYMNMKEAFLVSTRLPIRTLHHAEFQYSWEIWAVIGSQQYVSRVVRLVLFCIH